MILKLLLLVAVIVGVYFLFFKPKSSKTVKGSGTDAKSSLTQSDMVACNSCGTYVTLEDALLSDGKYYCSKECLNA